MNSFVDWLWFIPISISISLTLGPNNFLSMVNGMKHGPWAATQACSGRVVAFAVYALLTAFGLGVLLATSQTAFELLKWGGVLYLAYLGLKIMRSPPEDNAAIQGQIVRKKGDLLRKEFTIAIANPKAILIMTAVLPQFIDPAGDYTQQFLIIGTTFLATEYVAAAIYGGVGHVLGARNFNDTIQRRINIGTGGMFIVFAALLALSEQEAP